MAKDTESVPDPLAESEEESGEEEASSEEEDKASGTESESESEPESKQTVIAHPINKPSSTLDPSSKNPKPQTPNFSSEEEGSESESESESETKSKSESVTNLTIKPIASKPVGNDQKVTAVKKSKSQPHTASLSSLSKLNPTAGAKRPATSEAGKDGDVTETKRPKKKAEKEIERADKTLSLNDDSRKTPAPLRLWSEEDEIVILKGMTDFSSNKQADPLPNIVDFHEFIKKLIHVNVTRTQLQSKIRGLHKKYLKNADIEKQGKGKIFTNNHEQKVFALSKKAWSNGTSTAGKSNGVLAKNVITKTPVIDFGEESNKEMKNSRGSKSLEKLKMENIGGQELGIEEWIMKNRTQLIDNVEKRAKIDEKWRRFKIEEAEMYSKKLELMLEEAKLILDTLKSS